MTFSLFIALGAALGLARIARKSSSSSGALRMIDAGFWVLLGGLAGGRLVHILVAWPYYSQHVLEIPQIWLGGLSGPGCAVGALLTLALVAAFSKVSLGRLAEALLPLALPVIVSAWLACWWGGSAYGLPVAAWWGVPAPDEWGEVALRWPVQPVGALLALLVFWLLDFETLTSLVIRPRPASQSQSGPTGPLRRLAVALESSPPGLTALLAAFFQGLVLAGLSFQRADPQPAWRGLRLDTWAWAALAGLSALALLSLLLLPVLAKKGIWPRQPSSAAISPDRSHP